MHSMLGESWLTQSLFVVAGLVVVGDLVSTLFAVVYNRLWYEKRMRPRFAPGFQPSCAVIVPCKGVVKNMEENLRAFFRFDYRSYQVIFTVESEDDAAVPVIRRILADEPRGKLVVAGLAESCAQKNHNLLAALEPAADAAVYVFADADIGPKADWLRELVLPLSSSDVVVATGFRWLRAERPGLGAMGHNYINIFIYTLFSVAAFVGEVGLWGGSMAIRRRDFEELDIAGLWGKTAVDDMSLSRQVSTHGGSAVVVPTCITTTDDLIESVYGGMRWFERQIMFLKAYYRRLWLYGAAPIALAGLAIVLWLPWALVASMSAHRTFFASGGAAPLLFIAGELLTVMLYPLMGSIPRFGRFLAVQPFLRATHAVSYFRTYFTNVITWAGVRYHLDRNGVVTRVERAER